MNDLEELRKGIALFNNREFFECHEVLEDQWRHEMSDLKDLYQAIIKIAVGFYHAERKNYVGAGKVLRKGLHQIEPYLEPGRAEFLELHPFVDQCTQCLAELERAEQGFFPFDTSHIPKLRWASDKRPPPASH
ncbi:DUF309 domain-containing protein [Candidatus Acetothermia bacterium]|nr:DUF309 domain-containing protein [Candidatus Acetothermia bacterium]